MSDPASGDEPLSITLPEDILTDEPVAVPGRLPDNLVDDQLPAVASKLAFARSLLDFLVKDCKYSDFMREILVGLMQAVKSEAGSFLEVDPGNSTLFFRAVVGQSSEKVANFTIPLGQGLVGYVVESRQPLVIANPKDNPLSLRSIQKAVSFEPRNLVALPVVIRGQVFGVFELLNRVGEESYTSNDVQLLSDLCEMATRVIETRLMLNWVRQTREKAA